MNKNQENKKGNKVDVKDFLGMKVLSSIENKEVQGGAAMGRNRQCSRCR